MHVGIAEKERKTSKGGEAAIKNVKKKKKEREK